MRTQQLATFILLLSLGVSASATEAHSLRLEFSNTPLQIVLSVYAEAAGKRVELVEEVAKSTRGTFFTIKDERPLTIDEYMDKIETELKQANIGLFAISTNRLVATWIKPPRPRAGVKSNYDIRRENRLKEMRARAAAGQVSGEDAEKMLQEYQMHLIRKGLAPLPLKLTPEMDDQLVKEGVLPATDAPQQEKELSNKPNGR